MSGAAEIGAAAPDLAAAAGARFESFDPATADAAGWARFHRYRRARHAESRPEDPPLDDAVAEQALRNTDANPELVARRFVILDAAAPDVQIGNVVYGCFSPTSPSYAQNAQTAQLQLAVLEPWRRRGIGRAALALAHALMAERGHTVALGSTSEADGKAFARAIGASEALADRESRLALGDLDWAMVERWAAEGPVRAAGARLMIFERVPEAIIEPFGVLYTETFNQQPLGEMAIGRIVFTPEVIRRSEDDLARLGARKISAAVGMPDGDLAGLTEIVHLASRPALAEQGLTGVRDRYRGLGIGKWLKAALLLHVRAELPTVRRVSTNNATDNAPMRAINARLGFRLHRETVNVQITQHALGEFLGR